MLTYKLWYQYYYEFWYLEYRLDLFEISVRVGIAFATLLMSSVTVILDIIFIPFYIIAFIIWIMRGVNNE